MKHALVFVMIAAAAAGCGKKKDGDATAAKAAEPAKPAPPPPPPPPFTGTLTIERVMGLDAAIGSPPPLALADALARAKAQAGEPTKIDGDRIGWAVVEGDDCAYAYITRSGDQVSMVSKAQRLAKGELPGNRKECLILAGVEVVPPEDPAAAGPPTDGSAVTVDGFRATAVPGRSKWKGQVVKVSGVVAGSSTSTSGSDSWTTVSLKAAADDAGKAVSCMAPKNAPPASVKIGDPVIATGTVKISEWTSMGSGDTTLEAGLDECAVAAAPPAKGGKRSK